ncbi:hypothetical protein [Zobellella iuensis]|uniref:Uncharacterized protein n=1 Tax=Zobellella iuensis TaxID=2803811 RepID=A0ABS1QR99_9GAMM|nr:hypothetical protein [Zobellella iuensis]MBL1377394.1 hypothetical protein [Zobellella iuensis]
MRIFFILTLIFSALTCHAGDDLYRLMIPGKYILVGKALDSETTYVGKVIIEDDENGFKVTRMVADKLVIGNGTIESATDAKVLRIRFVEDGLSYEQTCMVGSDLDNYARISCYLYQPDIQTMDPGLEVLFNEPAEA